MPAFTNKCFSLFKKYILYAPQTFKKTSIFLTDRYEFVETQILLDLIGYYLPMNMEYRRCSWGSHLVNQLE